MLDIVPEEVMHQVAAFLTPREIHRFFVMTSKDLRQTFADAYPTWRQVLGSVSHDVILPMLVEYGHENTLLEDYKNPRSSSYAKMARDIAHMERLDKGHWYAARYGSSIDMFSEQEAHSSVLITSPCKQKKYLGVFPGWGKAKKQVEFYDVTRLPEIRQVNGGISGAAGYFKYGHTSTKINDSLVILFGGLTCGGYRGAINLLTLVSIDLPGVKCVPVEVERKEIKVKQAQASGVKRDRRESSLTEDDDIPIEEEEELARAAKIVKGEFGSSASPMAEPIKPVRPGPWSDLLSSNTGPNSCQDAGDNVEEDDANWIEREDEEDDDNDTFMGDDDSASDSDVEESNEIIEPSLTSSQLEPILAATFKVIHNASSPFRAQQTADSPPVPTPRGYHTATRVSMCSQDYLVVWGGLGNRAEDDPHNTVDDFVYENDVGQVLFRGTKPLSHLEIMNCDTLRWHIDVLYSGCEPTSRYGHSCTYHPRTNSLIVMGGANGNDLLRNGDDLREVHLLTIVPPDNSGGVFDGAMQFEAMSFVWSQVRVDCGGIEGLQVPGRCHSVCLVGQDKLFIFGGSVSGTNLASVMNLKSLDPARENHRKCNSDKVLSGDSINSSAPDEGCSVCMYYPKIFGELPTQRLSALCAHVGKYFLIQGGYEPVDRDCLSDCQVLDICGTTV